VISGASGSTVVEQFGVEYGAVSKFMNNYRNGPSLIDEFPDTQGLQRCKRFGQRGPFSEPLFGLPFFFETDKFRQNPLPIPDLTQTNLNCIRRSDILSEVAVDTPGASSNGRQQNRNQGVRAFTNRSRKVLNHQPKCC